MNKEEAFKKIGEKLEAVQKEIDLLYDRIDSVCADSTYQEIIDSFSEHDFDKKLKKKEKEEKRQKTIELMKKKFPNFVKLFTELDFVLDGIDDMVELRKDKMDDIMEKLEDLEYAKQELEDRKADLDL